MLLTRLQDKKYLVSLSTSLALLSPAFAWQEAIAAQEEPTTVIAQAGTAGGDNTTDAAPQTYAERMAAEEAAQQKQIQEDKTQQKVNDAAVKKELQQETEESKERKANPAAFAAPSAESSKASTSSANNTSSSRPASSQPVKLYGRIEELVAGKGARIPLKMQAMVPIRDSSLDQKLKGKATTLAAGANLVQAFPMDYRGSWSGDITINSTNFDPSYFADAPAEANKESQMMRPGTKGHYNVTFYQDSSNKIEMQPSQVVFQGTESMGNQMKILEKSNPGMASMFGGGAAGGNPMMANMQLPVMFALHMGTPIVAGETGVTGNQLSSELMKNTLKELSKGILESEVVTRDHDRDPETGKVRQGFSESVLRFTRISNQQLYLQAAYVYYRSDGKFQSKFIFYGTLDRSNGQNAAQPANPFGGLFPGMGGGGAGANPFGMPGMGGAGAGGGAGNLQQQMNQMQQMIKKMSGQ